MAKTKKKTPELTASGFNYDQDLAKVPIKVFPALQALIANQHDLIEIAQKYEPDKFIFLEAHKGELAEVEEIIAQQHSIFFEKKEKAKAKRLQEKNAFSEPENKSFNSGFVRNTEFGDFEPAVERESEPPTLDMLAEQMSPGLPSAKYEPRKVFEPAAEKPDIRRIAVGASIKALTNLLSRKLTEEEVTAIEKEIDSYL
ncbi:hypothetical protein Dtox_2377 [Desulfofarcimen acetoxidans DSM 771]|jgi:hypothetical protein|uniref:Uncharacterized protein n=1 Tax=Desulfofarcimen acetoxidans (strain ATCC 49208 / DSM 771 / KCTC 5769 / VKM B-1644 / 5575) TaxID=485916 RepID=C8W0D3_DESAS|nr:hypothetical protein [Desulfofarcimen acetoxidans]ACV63188.1 hypothetical protein Dtox_2377 [Desulfofarcimen acetoxidans DSM 771]